MADRVQVLKVESAENGGDAIDSRVFPTPIQPQEDMIECAGVYLQNTNNRDENVYISREGNSISIHGNIELNHASGSLLKWSSSATPTQSGEVGMDLSTGRLRIYSGGSVRSLAYTDEISGGGGGGGGAPTDGTYLVLSSNNNLTNERVLAAGSGISISDGGPGNNLVISSTATTGAQGAQGAQGVTGAQGLQGATGAQGSLGLQGASGVEGPQGPQGPQGAQGASGVEGLQGPQGAQGTSGVQGAQGFTGAQGIQAAPGSTGSQGIQGAQGAIGPQGSQAAAGAPLDASYLVLSSNGNLSSERVLAAGTGISISDGGPGNVLTISSTVAGGAPADASYLVLSSNGNLSSERVLTAGSGISISDSGPGASLTISATGGGGGGSGDLILIESKYISSNTQSVVFSNLDGNTDRNYYLVGRRINGITTVTYEVRPNQSNANLYANYHIFGYTGSATIHTVSNSYGTNFFWGSSLSAGSAGDIEMFFNAESSANRFFNLKSRYTTSSSLYNNLEVFARWTSADNLTSLELRGTVSSAFAAGTEFHLYKLRRG